MEDSPLDGLPQEITLNILTRLPAELILDCKRVCKAWRNFIRIHANTTYFVYQHLERYHGSGLLSSQHCRELDHSDGSDSAPMSFVFLEGRGSQELYYAQFHEDDDVGDNQPNYSTKRININFGFRDNVCEIVGSCNGLICLSPVESTLKCLRSRPEKPLYIINPITREIVNLPGLSIDKKKHNDVRIAQGFGYLPVTNEYKVIRVWYEPRRRYYEVKGQVEVYTLGSGKGWRRIGETSHDLCWTHADWETTSGVWFNSAIHWLDEESTGIVAFDLETEGFKVLPTPTDRLTAPFRRSLRVTRGSLCYVCAYIDKGSWEADFWFLRKNKEETNSTYHAKKLYNKSWSMSNYSFGSKLSFAVTKRGETLIAGQGLVRLYDLETRTWKEIWQSKYGRSSFWAVPVLHINSFVSLKSLGERSAKTFKELRNGDNLLTSSGPTREAKRCAEQFKGSWDGDDIIISSAPRRDAKRFK